MAGIETSFKHHTELMTKSLDDSLEVIVNTKEEQSAAVINAAQSSLEKVVELTEGIERSMKNLMTEIISSTTEILRQSQITMQGVNEEIIRNNRDTLSTVQNSFTEHTDKMVDVMQKSFDSIENAFVKHQYNILNIARDQCVSLLDYELENFSKFHLCYCGTLKNSENKNRFNNRYVATTRTIGDFLVNVKIIGSNDYDERDVYKPLSVCKKCLRSKKLRKYFPYTQQKTPRGKALNPFLTFYKSNCILQISGKRLWLRL